MALSDFSSLAQTAVVTFTNEDTVYNFCKKNVQYCAKQNEEIIAIIVLKNTTRHLKVVRQILLTKELY